MESHIAGSSDDSPVRNISSGEHPVRIHLFGAFRAEVGSNIVGESGWRLRKSRSLVKLLALAPGRRLNRELIVDLLWPDLEWDAAANNLRTTVHVARSMLESAPDALAPALATHGKLLALYPDHQVWIDVEEFEHAAAAARLSRNPEHYRRAIAYVHGELLAEDRYESWAEERRESVRRLWLALLRELADIYDGSDDPHQAITTLLQLTSADPADERAHVALMRLYAGIGQRLQAVRQYQYLRDSLQKELDVEPEPATSQLYEEILSDRFAATTRQAARPPHAPEASPEDSDRHPVHLPPNLTSFIGREQEVAEVAGLLDQSRLITLTGPGGTGKTRLAIEVARARRNQHTGGIWFIDLAGTRDPALVIAEIAATLGTTERPGQSLIAAIAERLGDGTSLILLDNCEHLIDACAELADRLLRETPRTWILATSREALRVPGEVIWPTPPLRVEPVHLSLADANPGASEAVRLFVDRARLANPGFRRTEQNTRAIVDLCRNLEGMPLAIELAAARIRVVPVEMLASSADGGLRLLGGGARTLPARQQSVRDTIDWSYDLLSIPERILFCRLAVFEGGFSLTSAEDVCSGPDLQRGSILELLFQLADKSLIVPQPVASSPRFRMMEPLRQYARERIVDDGWATLGDRHLTHFLAFAGEAAQHLTGPDVAAWADRLDRERDNLNSALRWSVTGGMAEYGLRLGVALWRYWLRRGNPSEGRRWLETVIAIPGAADSRHLLAEAQFGSGMLAWIQGDVASADAHYAACLDIAQSVNHREMIASAQSQIARSAMDRGDDLTAERLLESGLLIRRELGLNRESAVSLTLLGEIALRRSAYAIAQSRFEESLALQEAAGDPVGQAWVLGYLSDIAAALDDRAGARQFLERGVALAATTPALTPALLARLSQVAFDQGYFDEAAHHAQRCLQLSVEMSLPSTTSWGISIIAAIAAVRGDVQMAILLDAAAVNLENSGNVSSPRRNQQWIAARIDPARRSLDVAASERATAQGRTLTVEQAVATALATVSDPQFDGSHVSSSL